MMKKILQLDPASYQRHMIHGADRNWIETNCYVDVWIELLHAWGHEPIAALPFTFGIDFEGDQWTFFKFPHADLFKLYGIHVQELAIWKPLTDHIQTQIERGNPVLVELDSYYLPDTAGTAYSRVHTKSTVAVNEIDIENRRLGYFHNQGYFQLTDVDFVNVFHLNSPNDPARLPPYVEFAKPSPTQALRGNDLLTASLTLFREQLNRMPRHNPFESFKSKLEADLPWLQNEMIDTFHLYSFATLRQFGACYELAATYLQWLRKHNVYDLEGPLMTFSELAMSAKTLQFQLARTMTRKKPLEMSVLDSLALRWHEGVTALQDRFG